MNLLLVPKLVIFSYTVLAISLILLIIAAVLDSKDLEVDWRVLFLATILALVFALTKRDFSNLILALISGTIVPALLVLISKQKWMGFGDVLFAAAGSLLCGYPNSLVGIFVAFIAASLFGIIYLTAKPKLKILPFGPFLVFGCLIGIWFGQTIIFFFQNI